MTGIERAISAPYSRDEKRYCMRQAEINYLYQGTKGEPFGFAIAAFRYGFEKGRRCEMAKRKREKQARYAITPAGLEYLEGRR